MAKKNAAYQADMPQVLNLKLRIAQVLGVVISMCSDTFAFQGTVPTTVTTIEFPEYTNCNGKNPPDSEALSASETGSFFFTDFEQLRLPLSPLSACEYNLVC